MQKSNWRRLLFSIIGFVSFFIYQYLTFRQTLLSGTPGDKAEHMWNITLYIIIMAIEFFILFLGYDFVVKIFSPDFMSNHRISISILSLISTAFSAMIAVIIYKFHFLNVVAKYKELKKHDSRIQIDHVNTMLTSNDHIFYLTLMCALLAISLALFISALIEIVSDYLAD